MVVLHGNKRVKVIVTGINRSGTNLTSFLITKACNLRNFYLEPYYWDRGFDTKDWFTRPRNWEKNKLGMKEHRRLPVYCDSTENSDWLNDLLNNQG